VPNGAGARIIGLQWHHAVELFSPLALAQIEGSPHYFKMINQNPPTNQLAPSIRVARVGDASEIRRIARMAYAKYTARIGREPAPMAADYDTDIAAGRTVVIETDAKLCGYMVAWREGDAYFIENIAIAPQYQESGLARLLMEHAVSEARRAGLAALSLYTNEAMTENLAMYAHIGFVETHRQSEDGFRRVYMRWTF
jgi:ribosomal protein S18 acetylase RimI-like enzyme